MTLVELICSKKLDDFFYATLSVPVRRKNDLMDRLYEVIEICRNHNAQKEIRTNANGLNSIRITFDWRCLWYNAHGTKHKNWGDELDALLAICRMYGGSFVIADQMVGYDLDVLGNVKDQFEIFDDV